MAICSFKMRGPFLFNLHRLRVNSCMYTVTVTFIIWVTITLTVRFTGKRCRYTFGGKEMTWSGGMLERQSFMRDMSVLAKKVCRGNKHFSYRLNSKKKKTY